jgi:outer membrane protein TolC
VLDTQGQERIHSSRGQLEFNRKSFVAVEKKFEEGTIDVTDYSAQRHTFQGRDRSPQTKLQLLKRKTDLRVFTPP